MKCPASIGLSVHVMQLYNIGQPSQQARVAKLVDARDLKSLALTGVPVRVRPRAPYNPATYSQPPPVFQIRTTSADINMPQIR